MPIQTYRPSLSDTIYYGNPVNKDAPLNRGKVAWWLNLPLLKGRPKLTDLMGKYPGTLVNGPTWQGANGRPGGFGSLSFDGTDDFVEFGTYAPTTPISVCFWAKVTDASILQTLWSTGSADNLVRIFTNSGSLVAQQYDGSAANALVSISSNVWYHIVAVFLPPSYRAIYVNGGQMQSSSTDTLSSLTPSYIFWGKAGWSLGDQFANFLGDDLTVYNIAIPANEVYALYEESRRGYPTTLNRLSRTAYFVGGAAPPAGGNNVIPFLASRVRGIGVGVTIG